MRSDCQVCYATFLFARYPGLPMVESPRQLLDIQFDWLIIMMLLTTDHAPYLDFLPVCRP